MHAVVLQGLNSTDKTAGGREKQTMWQLPSGVASCCSCLASTAFQCNPDAPTIYANALAAGRITQATLITLLLFTDQLLLLPPCFTLMLLLQVTKGFIDPPGKNIVHEPKGVPTKEIFRRFFADPSAGKAPKNPNGPATKPPKI
jgi:hypothetical protein